MMMWAQTVLEPHATVVRGQGLGRCAMGSTGQWHMGPRLRLQAWASTALEHRHPLLMWRPQQQRLLQQLTTSFPALQVAL